CARRAGGIYGLDSW
nr:immunoglobulin heavy chain junction region [Macaca mulatta]MOW91299.1 immunoglobulin heavy chain junction region [Macaca mulatta]